VTKDDIDLGRGLLRAVHDPASWDRFNAWQEQHFGCSDKSALESWRRCALAGNIARAERLFDAVAAPLLADEWHNGKHATAILALLLGKLLWTLLLLAGAIGGAAYLLSRCGS
jgi:hypothetical protein